MRRVYSCKPCLPPLGVRIMAIWAFISYACLFLVNTKLLFWYWKRHIFTFPLPFPMFLQQYSLELDLISNLCYSSGFFFLVQWFSSCAVHLRYPSPHPLHHLRAIPGHQSLPKIPSKPKTRLRIHLDIMGDIIDGGNPSIDERDLAIQLHPDHQALFSTLARSCLPRGWTNPTRGWNPLAPAPLRSHCLQPQENWHQPPKDPTKGPNKIFM